jgi:type VI secretion system protein ImpA
MRFDGLLSPVSDAEPCGPDLDEDGDDAYLNYVLGAGNRLPERYINPETGAPFDRGAVDLKAETSAIAALLERSRDLRLLTLDVRFHALAGQIEGMVEGVAGMAALLDAHWDHVHPRGMDGEFTLRQNTVLALDDRATTVLPLRHAPILVDQRAGSICLNDYMLATGAATPREDERVIDVNQILFLFNSEAHRPRVETVHAALIGLRANLARIATAFAQNTDYAFPVEFDLLSGVAADILKAIEAGRTDLGAKDETTPPPDNGATADFPEQASGPTGGGRASAPASAVGAIANQAASAAALLAAEGYFGRNEPSSPALILVHQARLLVGRPLVEALEALLPDNVEYATIPVDPTAGFSIGIAKMRTITEDYVANAEVLADDPEVVPSFEARTRAEALQLLAAVSAFYRSAEPSSPIPMMLGRAERFANQSFQSILAELMPRPSS